MSHRVLHLVLILVVSIAFPLCASAQRVIDTWAEDHYAAILDQVFPVADHTPDPAKVLGRITIRVVPSGLFPDERELSLIVEQLANRTTRLTVEKPVGGSVLAQIRTIREEHPNWDVNAVAAAVQMERRTETVTRRSRYSRSTDRLLAARIPILPESPFYTDPTTYSIRSWTPAGAVQVLLMGPGARSPKQSQHFLAIIEDLRRKMLEVRE
jgi:hypothetical protein